MRKTNASILIASFIAIFAAGCAQDKTPDVVTTPGSTTVIHDKEPGSTPNVTVNTPPNVTVNTPPATHSETHTSTTTTPPDSSTGTTSTTQTSTTTTG